MALHREGGAFLLHSSELKISKCRFSGMLILNLTFIFHQHLLLLVNWLVAAKGRVGFCFLVLPALFN